MFEDVEYQDLKNAYIERELSERVKAVKLLNTFFNVDGIMFAEDIPNNIRFRGGTVEFDNLAHIVDKEVYTTTINDKEAEAFKYDSIEVYRYV